MQKQKMSTRYLVVCAMFIAISYVMVIAFKFVPPVAGFLSYEPKDAIVAIGGFLYGPMTSVLISVATSFLEMITISETGLYGLLMNVVSTCAFAVPAAWFYKKHKTMGGAVIGLLIGVVTMAACMVAWNYVITPFYMKSPDQTVSEVRTMVSGMLATVFLPFNLVKGGLNAGVTMLLYKPIVNALRAAKLAEPSQSSKKGKFSLGFLLFTLAVLATFILLLLALLGKI
jgi:riboflavin transporter FmnP